MQNVLLVIQILVGLALIAVILVQRTAQDGGGLMGGGNSTMGGLFNARGSANFLTRATAGLATAFILVSLGLAVLASSQHNKKSVLDQIAPVTQTAPEAPKAPKIPEVPKAQ